MAVKFSPSFRAASESDIPQLQETIRLAFQTVLSGNRINQAGLLEKMRAPDAALLVATEPQTDNPVSCCELTWDASRQLAYFGLFAVDPQQQGGGLGRQMLQYAEEYARGRSGARRVEMDVVWTRSELIAWYERRGYVVSGERRPFPHEQIRALGGKALRDDLYFEVLVKDL